ncbi:MAG TPA: glycosyltransferase family 2 protein [Gemmatimonadaceae bacterium]|nr:glycosyltransferase family 2 protein [Gemmatimonadaceae bacterium]
MSDRILVFIPCYNCEQQIGRVLAQFAGLGDSPFAELLIVDNGSRDRTVGAAVDALAELRGVRATVVRNVENYNLGGSHKAAFAYAVEREFTHVVVLHGDDQATITDVLPTLRDGTHRRFDACLGARFMSGSRLLGYSWSRRWGNMVFNLLFTLVSRRRVYDLGSGLNVFARSVFASDALLRYPDDLRFNVYLLLGLYDRGLRTSFFPISWREEDQRSNVRIVSQTARTVYIAGEYLLRRSRFRHGEHRSSPRGSYPFEVVARHDGGSVSHGDRRSPA